MKYCVLTVVDTETVVLGLGSDIWLIFSIPNTVFKYLIKVMLPWRDDSPVQKIPKYQLL